MPSEPQRSDYPKGKAADTHYRFDHSAWMKDRIAALESELQRLCGPVCPHDGKRAIEHTHHSHLSDSSRIVTLSEINDSIVRAHGRWPEGAQWLRERGGRV